MQEPHLLERAKRHRRALTPFEAKLWSRLSRAQLGGFKFRRQHVIGNCIVDFFCPDRGLIVEIDGDTHDPARDAVRDRKHRTLGFTTVRFTNAEVGKNFDEILDGLQRRLESSPNRWWGVEHPHPRSPAASRPSPKGEGSKGK